jgi:hypothetical protein
MTRSQSEELSREELEQQSGEQLPDREAMSLIDPALGGGTLPVDPDWQPPHHQHDPEPGSPPIAD